MASKSKKRRRVLGASCILAALIIAGSSFAWFTSKDEVTNRLSASSDYGVSIVESFAPPKNWLPGQVVNKDVYAVNTGNIDAYVKENVKGVLNYTYEDLVTTFDTTKDKYVELTLDQVKAIEGKTEEDGFKTYEAGGYLAWTNAVTSTTTTTPATYKVDGKEAVVTELKDDDIIVLSIGEESISLKYKVEVDDTTYYTSQDENDATLYSVTVAVGNDDTTTGGYSGKKLTKTDASTTTTETSVESGSVNSGRKQDITSAWKPTGTGVYVFRRAINTKDATNPFTYSGYYFDASTGKYYKIVLGSDKYPAAKTTQTTLTDGSTRVDFVYDIYADSKDVVANVASDIDKDTGEIKTDVGYMFVVEKEKKDQDVTFTYDANGGKPRLVAEYTVASTGNDTYDANALAARAQVEYQNALGQYEAAKASYDNAVANHAYGKALAEAEQALYNAKVNLENKYADVYDTSSNPAGAKTQWEDAQKAVNDAAKFVDDESQTKPSDFMDGGVRSETTPDDVLDSLKEGIDALRPTSVSDTTKPGIMPDEVMQALDGNGAPADNKYVKALNEGTSDFRAAYDNYKKIYEEIYGTDGDANSGLYKDVTDLLDTIKTNSNESDTGKAATVKEASEELEKKAALLKTKMADLKKAYANFNDELNKVTGVDTTGTTTLVQKLTALNTVADNFATNAKKLDDLVDTLVNEEKEYVDAKDALTTATNEWKAAVKKYNTDVKAAKDAYNAATGSAKKAIEDIGAWDINDHAHEFEDRSDTLVPAYSAVSSVPDPAIPGDETTGTGVLATVLAYTGDKSALSGVNIRDLSGGDKQIDEADLSSTNFSTKNYIGIAEASRSTATAVTEEDWKTAIEKADGYKAVAAAKKAAYDAAVAAKNSGSTLKFYVNLDKDYAAYWTMDPDTDKTTKVDFYLNKVLEAGETSHKLIDSVEFDKDVSAGAYKELTFDLNVGLDSVQVTYDENQRGYTTEAVNADANFAGMKAEVTAADANGNNVKWTDNAGVPAAPVTP